MRNLPGGVAVFDGNERLVRVNGELEALFPDMKQQLRLGARYADFRDGLSQSMLPDRLGKRTAANLTEGGSPLGGRGALSVRHFAGNRRSEEHTSELQSLMRISYAVFCLNKKRNHRHTSSNYYQDS